MFYCHLPCLIVTLPCRTFTLPCPTVTYNALLSPTVFYCHLPCPIVTVPCPIVIYRVVLSPYRVLLSPYRDLLSTTASYGHPDIYPTVTLPCPAVTYRVPLSPAVSYVDLPGVLQAEARLREAYTSACRSGDGGYRSRRSAHDDPSSSHPPSTPQLPSVAGGSQSGRRLPLFSFKKNSAADTALSSSLPSSQREWRGRRSFLLTHNAHNAGHKRSKGHVRFQEEAGDAAPPGSEVSAELMELHSKHVEPRSTSQGVLGTYSVSEHPPRAASCKPPLPAAAAAPPEPAASAGQTRVTSAGIRSGRVREWLSVDSVPTSACRHRPRPSTVSSASSSTRSRDISSAKQRLAGSSRVSSASVKAASDPGVDLDNMDLVTLNLMARRAKGPSRYRYLAKLRSLNLNTPRPLV